MKRIYGILAAGCMIAGLAAAQEERPMMVAPQVKVLSLQGGVMGKTVKGAPYSGVEVTEATQVLADGTRIHNESQTQVYRDSEGRMRRETGNEVTIWDPVANASWVLNSKTQTARKLPMGTFYYSTSAKAGGSETVMFTKRVTENTIHIPAEADQKVLDAKVKAEVESGLRQNMAYAAGGAIVRREAKKGEAGKTESLGKRMIEGVNADGIKAVTTIEAGAIGNDRAIQSTAETWYSPELQTVMSTRRTDPRTGEETFKLTNVSRAEPPAYLFQVPAGYQISEMVKK